MSVRRTDTIEPAHMKCKQIDWHTEISLQIKFGACLSYNTLSSCSTGALCIAETLANSAFFKNAEFKSQGEVQNCKV